MTVVEQIARHLANQGIGTIESTLWWSYLPDNTDQNFNISVLDTGGIKPSIYLPTQTPTFQVFVRAADYATGKAKLDAIRDALHGLINGQLINGETFFYYIYAQAEGGHLGRNEAGRDEFSINFYAKTR